MSGTGNDIYPHRRSDKHDFWQQLVLTHRCAANMRRFDQLTSDTLTSSILWHPRNNIQGDTGTQDQLYGANDVVFDLFSGDDVIGGTGADTLLFTGTVAASAIQAGSGNDSIVLSGTGMTGNTIDLGVGADTVKFTKTTNSDTVTISQTSITGAKNVTYEKAATAAAITTGAGADVVVFEAAASAATTIATHSGNDSIQFLKNADIADLNLGAGADSLYGAQIISNSTISGAAGQDTFLISTLSNALLHGGADVDSLVVTGSLLGATIDFGAGN